MRKLSTSVALATSFAVLALSSAGCHGPRAHARSAQAAHATAPASVEVVALSFAVAEDAAHLLNKTVGSRNLRVQADARTNSVVLAGSAADLELAKRVLAQLDVQVPQG
jgi:type II secretory pathway component GspD/PulD (secretin)